MAKLISILVQVLALVALVCGGPEDYDFLGRLTNSDYWVSRTALPATGVITPTCVADWGKGSVVTKIANLKEWNWLKGRLAEVRPCIGCTQNIWCGGRWDITNVPAGSSLAITVKDTTVGTKIFKRTNAFQYICEIPITTTATPTTTTTTTAAPSPYKPNTQDPPANPRPVESCPNDNDVIVVLDSSGSIGTENYKKEKLFAYDLARSFENAPTSRFGFTIFSSSVRRIAPLDHTFTPDELNSRILNADYMGYQTFTHSAIDSAVAEFLTSTRSVRQNLVVITDGTSNFPTATSASIRRAIDAGIRTFAVGIGSTISYDELRAIANNNDSRIFTADNFDVLTEQLNPLRDVVCAKDE